MSYSNNNSQVLDDNSHMQLLASTEGLGQSNAKTNMRGTNLSRDKSKSSSNISKVSNQRQAVGSQGSKLPYTQSNENAVQRSTANGGSSQQRQNGQRSPKGKQQQQQKAMQNGSPNKISTGELERMNSQGKSNDGMSARQVELLKNISRKLDKNETPLKNVRNSSKSFLGGIVNPSINDQGEQSSGSDGAEQIPYDDYMRAHGQGNRRAQHDIDAGAPNDMSVSDNLIQRTYDKSLTPIRASRNQYGSNSVQSHDNSNLSAPYTSSYARKVANELDSVHNTPYGGSTVAPHKHGEINGEFESMDFPVKQTGQDDEETEADMSFKRKAVKCWDNFLFKPSDPFKVKWDIFVIVLSVWNAIQIPMTFAWPLMFDDKKGFEYSDYIIDFCFIFDIVINFRSCYVDSRTDELVENPTKIRNNYMSGRFWVDLVASCNFDLIFSIFLPNLGESAITQLFGMLKLVRLLRLGRMITYLSKSKSAKFGAKIVELFFMLVLLLHWNTCIWFVISKQENAWVPSKDLDWDETIVFTSAYANTNLGYFQSYAILFYYACLALLGNDYVPTNSSELIVGMLLVLVGVVAVGYIVGAFAQLLSDADKAKRRKNAVFESLSTKMTNLRVPEAIYVRVSTYYEEKMKIRFVSDRAIYKNFNKAIKTQFCAHQMKEPIQSFIAILAKRLEKITKSKIDIGHHRLVNIMSTISKTSFYLSEQTIIRQDALPDGFYFIIDGECVVYLESEGDFRDFDYFEEKLILEDPEDNKMKEEEEDPSSPTKSNGGTLGDESAGSPFSPYKKRKNLMDIGVSQKSVSFIDLKPTLNQQGSQEFMPETPYLPYSENPGPGTSVYSAADELQSQATKNFNARKALPAANKKGEEEKSKLQQFKEFFSANEVEVKKEDEEEEIQRNIKLKRIADLEKGDFFGEISLLTKLRRTSSVFSASNVTCGFIPKSKFRQLLQDNHEFKDSITRYLHTYKDKNIRLLVTMIKNVPAFRTISVKSAKDITFALKNLTAPANENILRKGEISKKCFFVKEGCIDVMVRQNDESQPPYLMARLGKGACFNFMNSFMERPSLFDYVVSASNDSEMNNGTTLLYVLEKDDFDALCKYNEELLNSRTTVQARATEDTLKYDFDRMVYSSLDQLKRAQQMKKRYEASNQVELDSKPANSVMAILARAHTDKGDEVDSVFKVSGKGPSNFKASIEKFKQSINQFRYENFYIRDMQIFQLVDESFDKFSGYAMNLDLAVMLYTGEHEAHQRQMVKYYLKKNQGKIERDAAKRTIMSGLDHLTMAQQGYIARQKNDQHYNEEGEVVYQGDYTQDQTALRQMQLFKLQQEKLDQLTEACMDNSQIIENIKQQFVKTFTAKSKKIDALKQQIDFLPSNRSSRLHDKNVDDVLESARRLGIDAGETLDDQSHPNVQIRSPPFEEQKARNYNTHMKGQDESAHNLVTSPDQRRILMNLKMQTNTDAKPSNEQQVFNDYTTAGNARSTDQTHAHFRNASEPSNLTTMQKSSPMNKISKISPLVDQQLFNTESERAATQNMNRLQGMNQTTFDEQKRKTQKLSQINSLSRDSGPFNMASSHFDQKMQTMNGSQIKKAIADAPSDYTSQGKVNKNKTATQVGNLLMSDQDSSEVAEKLQAIDKRQGRQASINSNEQTSERFSNPNQSNREVQKRNQAHNGSNPFIKNGAASLERKQRH